ncbi:MAG: hypothetical protein ACE37F_05280 [Nannocystaceae bacterium]|nr:hypothetical protein [bacterium]
MSRSLLLLGLVAATACFEEPASAPRTPAAETSTGAADTSSGDAATGDAPSTGSVDPSTSDGASSSSEGGSSETGGGCSDDCDVRECVLAHVDASIHAVSVEPDGALTLLGALDLAPHEHPWDAPIDGSIVRCNGGTFVATNGSDEVSSLTTMGDELAVVGSASAPGVLELACDESRGLLFALRLVSGGYALDLMEAGASPEIIATAEYNGGGSADLRTVELALDRDSGRATVGHIVESTASTPIEVATGTYSTDALTLQSPTPLPVVHSDLSSLYALPQTMTVIGLGARAGADAAAFRFAIAKDGTSSNVQLVTGPPWDARRNLWPLRVAEQPGFAMGGSQGVVLGTFGEDGEPTQSGPVLAATLTDTLARTAHGGDVLVVVSPAGVSAHDAGAWDALDTLDAPLGEALHGAAVVPCP